MKQNSSKLRVAILLPSLANMGPIRVAFDLVTFMLPRVDSVTVFYFDKKEGITFNCKTTQIPFSFKIDESNFDVIHSHGFRPDMYVAYHRFKKMKKITTLHSNVFEELESSHGKFLGWILAAIWTFFLNHNKIVVLSNYVKSFYRKKIRQGDKRLFTIYNGRDIKVPENSVIDREQDVLNLRMKNQITLGSVSVLTKRKGIDQLLKVVAYNPRLSLIIIGNGPEEERLKELVKVLGVGERVLFLGYQKNAIGYYKFFDIFCLSSYSEGFPLGLLEAIQLKVPAVVSNLPIYHEMFTNGIEIETYELNNIANLNVSIQAAFNNRDSLIKNSYHRVENEYSFSAMGNKYLQIYA